MNQSINLTRAEAALEGLSVGDAFGERFFGPPITALQRIDARALPSAPWGWTDDTAMARVLFELLAGCGRLDADLVATAFAAEYVRDPARGYGRGAHTTLSEIATGVPWEVAARSEFPSGSFGNGAAMRVAVVGAFYADDPEELQRAVVEASSPTHIHEEGIAGAHAVAAATAFAARTAGDDFDGPALLRTAIDSTPAGRVLDGLKRAFELGEVSAPRAAELLGSGAWVCAYDTVPFALYCASRWGDSFEDAMWQTVSGLGDRDTTCAIVGGILGARGIDRIPMLWRHSRERL